MTADSALPPSDSQFLMTDAALECLDVVIGLAATMAPHTRHPRFLEAAGAQALGGLMDSLEVYYRRLRELIDPQGKPARDAYKNREWLNERLGGSPISEQQQQHIALLKDIRNLSVHNNGVVDAKFEGLHPGMFAVGDRVPVFLYSTFASAALWGVLHSYDQQITERYSHLGRIVPVEKLRSIGRLLEEIQGMINVTPEEWPEVEDVIDTFNTSGLPFTFEGVQINFTQAAFGLRWMTREGEDGLYAVSQRGVAAGPFPDEAALQLWLTDGRMVSSRITSQRVDEQGWVTATTDEGFSLYGHPEDLAQIVEG